jgi:ankyrin repeat protein
MLVNRRDGEQLTALHWAAISSHAPHTRALLLNQV